MLRARATPAAEMAVPCPGTHPRLVNVCRRTSIVGIADQGSDFPHTDHSEHLRCISDGTNE